MHKSFLPKPQGLINPREVFEWPQESSGKKFSFLFHEVLLALPSLRYTQQRTSIQNVSIRFAPPRFKIGIGGGLRGEPSTDCRFLPLHSPPICELEGTPQLGRK
uniref:Uncharacterized protein n=1 Tax=Picea glauca TaxID=3330 RepID=A0A101LYV0_PICGL|nr:hypothetical protein ABT39_MTgene4870 [Picea glauca]